jgi:drug/metabolite transporter (DMT)-like permease
VTDNRRLFTILAILNVLWVPVNLMVRIATEGGMTPATIALSRWGTLGVLLLVSLQVPAFRKLTRARWPTLREAAFAIGIGMILFAPSHALYYVSLGKTSTVEGIVLGTTAPVWTALLAFLFLRERVSGRRASAIALGLAGAWIVSLGFRMPQMDAGHTTGNLMYLTGVLSESAAGVLSASLIRRASGITILVYQIIGATISFALIPLLFPSILPHMTGVPTLAAVGAVAYLVLVPGLVCFGTWYMLVERTPLSLMVVSVLLQPPLGALLGWWALGEVPTAELGLGTVIVLAALALSATEKSSGPIGALDEDELKEEVPSVPVG